MATLDITKAQSSDMTNQIEDYDVGFKATDGVTDQDETFYTNPNWTKQWAYFNEVSDLKSAILMKAIWNVGKGWNSDAKTKVILENIRGLGKDQFDSILFNMEVVKYVGGDSYAQIIWNDLEKLDFPANIKPLDPSSIRQVHNRTGEIIRYEQINKNSKAGEVIHKFKPEEILHFSNNRLADQIHGISEIDVLEPIIKADGNFFKDMAQIMHHQAKPFILWKLKTDDPVKIAAVVAKIDAARKLGEDTFIPDDDDAISYEVVQINVSAIIIEWANQVKNKFYRALGLPQVVFGSAGTTESGGKVEYLAHEQIFEKGQRQIELDIWAQLKLKIDLISPVSLLENLKTDQNKDGVMQQMNMQPSDANAARGR